MVENTPIPRPAGPDPTREVGRAKKPLEPQDATGGPAFQALLEKLQAQARTLQGASEEIVGPEDLSGAIGRAEETLRDALSLSDQLLEAYRESVVTDGDGAADSATDGATDRVE